MNNPVNFEIAKLLKEKVILILQKKPILQRFNMY